MTKRTLFIALFFMGFFCDGQAQVSREFDAKAKTKTIFIYGFTKYFKWPEECYKGDFRIGVMGADENLVYELKKLAELKRVGEQRITIINFNEFKGLNAIPSVHVLYVDISKTPSFKLINVAKNTLVVSYNDVSNENAGGLYNAAIGFKYIEDKLKFSYNEDIAALFGLEPNEGFKKLAVENYDLSTKKGKQVYNELKVRFSETSSNSSQKAEPSATVSNNYPPGQPFDAITKTKAIFMYGFTKYFEWKDLEENADFKIGVYGATDNILFELRKIASIKKFGTHSLSIINLNDYGSVKDFPTLNVLYYDQSSKKINLAEIPKNTLVIKDNGGNEYNNAMINFIYDNNKVKWVYCEALAKRFGLLTKEEFKALAFENVDKPLTNYLSDLNKSELGDKKNNELTNASVKSPTLVPKEISPVKEESVTKLNISPLKMKEANNKWEDILEKIQSNLDEVTLSKGDLKQLSSKYELQEKDLEKQQLQIDFQMTSIDIQKQLMEQQEKNIKEKEAKLIVQLNRIEAQKTIIWLSAAAILAVLFSLWMLFRNYAKTKKTNELLEFQKSEIQTQKQLVEEKQNEILDSIHYAQRIQKALLASDHFLNENLPKHFVFYQPKDVVSGDFYWAYKPKTISMNSAGVEGELTTQNFILVTADSTGHGVPGSIMSMLNISNLEKAVEVEKLIEPKDILNHTRKKIIEALKRDGSSEGGKDGMDCSLISLDFKNLKMMYAAAYNPVWIIRQRVLQGDNQEIITKQQSVTNLSEFENTLHEQSATYELMELEPDRMPVGKSARDTISFTQHVVLLKKGDMIYTFTDGFPDQFGGPNGKKFMYKRFKELLLSISQLSMPEQKQQITTALKNWQGENEQVDDITLIGIRV